MKRVFPAMEAQADAKRQKRKEAPRLRAAAPPSVLCSVGTDFSGLDTPIIALSKLGIKIKHVFSSDNSPSCKKLIMHCHAPGEFYDDIQTRNHHKAPPCDVYFTGFPCQAFSSLGNQEGTQDKHGRGLLMFDSLDYIRIKQPKVVVAENVATLKTRFAPLHKIFIEALGPQYVVEERLVNTADHGLPHARRRWYLVAIRKDCYRKRCSLSSVFPEPMEQISLKDMIQPLPAKEWSYHPSENAQPMQYKNVINAYVKVTAAGVNPFATPVIVDTHSSPQFSTYKLNGCPCMTRTRSAQFGYWCSTKGGYLSPRELGRLQGFTPNDVDWKGAKITASQYGACLGNAMSLNVVLRLLPPILYQSKIIDMERMQALDAQARAAVVAVAS